MEIQKEEDILKIVSCDTWMMDILYTVKTMELPDWWVCAGVVRSKIWDVMHGFSQRTMTADIDVIYFDSVNTDEKAEKRVEQRLREKMPGLPWSVKNQARMHVINNLAPYPSSVDAISKFPETATSLGLSLNDNNDLVLAAPWGIEDVIHLQVKPTPLYTQSIEKANIYEHRIHTKKWHHTWKRIQIHSAHVSEPS